MAAAAAAPNSRSLPASAALCAAPAQTFSKIRGTTSRNVGLKPARSSSSSLALAVWPTVVPALRQITWTARARTWASGRNIRVRAWGCSRISGRNSTMFLATRAKFPWVISQPLGRPVVPEV